MQTEQAICESQNGELENGIREMQIIRVGMRGTGWECGCRESMWECGESRWKYKKCR